MKTKKAKLRDRHRLAMIKRETRGYTTSIRSKKLYSRKIKHNKAED